MTDAVQGHVVKWPAGMHPVDQAGTWFKMPLYQWQVDVLKAAAEPYSRVVVSTNNESGKCLDLETRVRLASGGTKRMGDLVIGDMLIDIFGLPTKITAIFDHEQKECVRLEFSRGGDVLCDMNHRWPITIPLEYTDGAHCLVMDTEGIVARIKAGKRTWFNNYTEKSLEAAKVHRGKVRDVRCITVDSFSHTYVLDGGIVTHNTSCVGPIFILSAMMAFPGARCFATSGSEEQIRAQFFETNLLPIIRPLQAYGWKVWTGDSGRVLAPNGSTLLCYVCKDANKAEGFHAGWNSATGLYEPCVYLSDESKEVKDGIHEAIRRINPTFFLGMSSPGENNWFSRGINQEQLKVIVEQRGGEDTPQRLKYKALAERILED